MLATIYNKLIQGDDTRQSLIALREEIKKGNGEQFLILLKYDYSLFRQLLEHEDAKVRKNAALIIGEQKLEGLVSDLFEAYESEETLFVKTAYLKAMKGLPYAIYQEQLKAHLDQLLVQETKEEEQKHVSEEIRELTALLDQLGTSRGHRFHGFDEPGRVILTTNRLHPEVTRQQLPKDSAKLVGGGVSLNYQDMRDFQSIRTYAEILFPLPSAKNMPYDPKEMAHTIMMAGILKFLDARHTGDKQTPYKFRVEMRGRLDLNVKKEAVKKLAAGLEKESGHRLVNSTSGYEVEVRLMENKEGLYQAYLKLYTIKDNRFAYRKYMLPTSINPVTAATIMELAKPYLTEGAQVLDPFCGTGTMLIERSQVTEAHPLYGVDIYGKAIDYARENAAAAKLGVNYINRDFADFRHEYLFDEIITNMPSVMGQKMPPEIEAAYGLLFRKLPEHLKEGGILILYSQDPAIARKYIGRTPYVKLLEKWQIYQKEGSYLYVLKYVPQS